MKLSDPTKPKGVRPINSLKVSFKGFFDSELIKPSLNPLGGSLICQVKRARSIPGMPTAIKATCHPFRPNGASEMIGYALFQLSTIRPPMKIPIPEPM